MKLLDNLSISLASYSFRGYETNESYPLTQQSEDLKEVITFLLNKGFKKIILIPTSMGFVSTAAVMIDPKYSIYIDKVIMLDPADYPADYSRVTWTGCENFAPTSRLLSDKLKNIPTPKVIDIVFFCLRNFDEENKNRTNEDRDVDNPNFSSRLNIDMSQNIFSNLPKRNQGKFIVDK